MAIERSGASECATHAAFIITAVFAFLNGASWTIAEAAIAAGAEGALTPSVQNAGGVTLVLWRWHAATNQGDGAALALIDPMAALD